jgi:hypothetical protein
VEPVMSRPFLLGFVLVASIGFVNAEPEHAKKTSFASIVEANFSKWDLNHDGKLSVEETNQLVVNHAITADASAAVASIHVYLRNKKHNGPLTREMLIRPAGKGVNGERRDKAETVPHFENNFQAFRRHIAKAPRELFVGNAPSLAGFSQGNLGDCYLLSAVGAAIARNPAGVKQMFHPQPNGSCDLTFANGRRVHVTRLTDAEIALGSSAGPQGLWLNVLEKGFGQLKLATSKQAHHSGLGLDVISTGGDADDTIELLTGHRAGYLAIRTGKGKDRLPPAENRVPLLTAQLRQILRVGNAVHPLLCCGTSAGKLPPGVVSDHDYAILGYDSAHDSVLVWNPWGNHHALKGAPGLQNGYAVEGGKFSVPLHDFVRIFEGVYYETALLPHKRK